MTIFRLIYIFIFVFFYGTTQTSARCADAFLKDDASNLMVYAVQSQNYRLAKWLKKNGALANVSYDRTDSAFLVAARRYRLELCHHNHLSWDERVINYWTRLRPAKRMYELLKED